MEEGGQGTRRMASGGGGSKRGLMYERRSWMESRERGRGGVGVGEDVGQEREEWGGRVGEDGEEEGEEGGGGGG